jgi:cold shock CspA family protein
MRIGAEKMMKSGKLRRWMDSAGYGFLKRDGGGPDLFLHRSQVIASGVDPDDLAENGRIFYEIGKDKSGRDVAINIKLP